MTPPLAGSFRWVGGVVARYANVVDAQREGG
jgi:hypothetical protein